MLVQQLVAVLCSITVVDVYPGKVAALAIVVGVRAGVVTTTDGFFVVVAAITFFLVFFFEERTFVAFFA